MGCPSPQRGNAVTAGKELNQLSKQDDYVRLPIGKDYGKVRVASQALTKIDRDISHR